MMPIDHTVKVYFRRWNDQETNLGNRSSLDQEIGFELWGVGKGGMEPGAHQRLCLADDWRTYMSTLDLSFHMWKMKMEY